MRQLTFQTDRTLAWTTTVDPPPPEPGGATVRPIAAATCDFDHLVVAGATPFRGPFTVGHECVAEVIEIGADVTSVAVGDLVVVPFQISCGRCENCRRGATDACSSVDWLACYGFGAASGGWGGVIADLVSVPFADAMLVRLPVGIDPVAAAAVGCNMVDAYRCVAPQLAVQRGAPVMVLSGAFPSIALYAVQFAIALGSDCVTFHDPDPAVADRARRLGAVTVTSLGDVAPRSQPVVVDASMNRSALIAALGVVARGGSITISTMYPDVTPIPMMELFETGATVRTGQPDARMWVEPVLSLIAAGTVDPFDVIDSVGPWDDAHLAFCRGKGKHVVER